MKRRNFFRSIPKDRVRQGMALAALLLIAALAIAGPTGLLAWSEEARLLDRHRTQIAKLGAERDELRNRVDLLDANAADPDLVGELLRQNLNVVHRDEVVITLEDGKSAQ